jgi:hypothetical protein
MESPTISPHTSAKPAPRVKRSPEHYVNNKEFSQAVVEYVSGVKLAKKNGKEVDRIPEYIGRCFLKIAEGLSHKPNFIRYTYREEMVMDGVENCIKAIMNYNVEAATRTGTPNAFAYFTQICYYAFIRRIMKEKKQQDIKMRYIEYAGIEDFMTESQDSGDHVFGQESGFIDVLKKRIDKVKVVDRDLKEFKKKTAVKPKKDLEKFMSPEE